MSILAEKCKNMAIRIQKPTLYLRVDKKKKDGKMPIYIRFQRVDGKEPKFPLGIDCLPEQWDNIGKHILDSDDLDIILQEEVNRIRKEVRNAEVNGIEITIDMLKEIVSEKEKNFNKPENQSFYPYFDEYIAKRLRINKIGDSTLKGYKTTVRALKAFRPEIRIKDIDTKLLENFDRFLIKRGEKRGAGAVEGSRFNRMRHIRCIIKFIRGKEINIKDPFKNGDFVLEEPPINETFLEKEEFMQLNKIFLKEVPIGSTDFYPMAMFIFCCLTGLRIGDVLSLKWGDIDRSKEPWTINKILKKKVGGKPVRLQAPISDYALTLIDWAQDDLNNMEWSDRLVFPSIAPNIINKILRKYAQKAGIDKYLTFHSSRRTCATFFVTNGIDNYALMRLMGHKNFNTTLRYTKWSPTMAREYADKVEVVKNKKKLIK